VVGVKPHHGPLLFMDEVAYMMTDADALRDLDALLNAPDNTDNAQLVAFAKKTVERLTLLADVLDNILEDGEVSVSGPIKQALKEHQQWKKGVL